jgi:hypothetical protein
MMRKARSKSTGSANAARIRRLRVRLEDAQRRGEDFEDAGEGLNHRALVRRFNQPRKCWGSSQRRAEREQT